MWAVDYTPRGLKLAHTWELPENILTWEAAALYMDEVHVVIDSIDAWRKKVVKEQKAVKINMADVRDAVNAVSSIQI